MIAFCAILAFLAFLGAMAEARPAAGVVAHLPWRERVTLTVCTFSGGLVVAAFGAAWVVNR